MKLAGVGPEVSEWLAPYLAEMADDSFVAELSGQYFSGRIGQDHFWAYRLSSWETLGLAKLNPDTGRPAVLADCQAEMKAAILLERTRGLRITAPTNRAPVPSDSRTVACRVRGIARACESVRRGGPTPRSRRRPGPQFDRNAK